MVPDTSRSTSAESPKRDAGSSTAINALIGGVAGIVLSFVPLSTLLGGALAGYLEGGTTDDGLRVGALAGLVVLVPFVLVGLFALAFFLGFGTSPGGPPIAFGLFAVVASAFGAVYTVGFGAVGGYLGVYLADEL